jgi:hypothetical protein
MLCGGLVGGLLNCWRPKLAQRPLTRFCLTLAVSLLRSGLIFLLAPHSSAAPQFDTHRKRGSWPARRSHRLDRRNLPTTQNPDSRLSLLGLAGLGRLPDQSNRCIYPWRLGVSKLTLGFIRRDYRAVGKTDTLIPGSLPYFFVWFIGDRADSLQRVLLAVGSVI